MSASSHFSSFSSSSSSAIFPREKNNSGAADDERVEEEEEEQEEQEQKGVRKEDGETKQERIEPAHEKKEKFSLLPTERITLLSPQRMVELSERINGDVDVNDAYNFVSLAEKRSAIATTLKWAYDGYMKVFPADELDPLRRQK
jgi:hypothetical protein